MSGEGADGEVVARIAHIGKFCDAPDVEHDGRRRESELHERDQRMATGQQLGLVAVLGQQLQGVPGRLGPHVVERRRDHEAPPSPPAALRTAFTMLW